MTSSTIVWFRQDLRLEDNPALLAAIERGNVIPLYIWNPEEEGRWPLGGASRWWLHHSLHSLKEDLKRVGLTLTIRRGKAIDVLDDIIASTGANGVFWNRRYEPSSIRYAAAIKEHLRSKMIDVQSFNGSLLYEPWTIANKQGKPFQVFTPFWRASLATGEPPPPMAAPIGACQGGTFVEGESLESLDLLPKIHWDGGIKAMWRPGTSGGKHRLDAFLKECVVDYKTNRDFPAIDGISKMSPYLHFGELSPRMIWAAVREQFSSEDQRVECFLRQLGWREFAHHLLYHFPKTPEAPLREDYNAFPWVEDTGKLAAWKKGMTGYPFVDAGMRELWHTGWMHNRVRMVVGSFLVKDLLISWTEGARWFWDTLVDADLANNTLGWQWVGGCGADAAPYFRIFNPCTQGEKFDPEGAYVRKWVPELKHLPNKWIHRPWEAPREVLSAAGVTLGREYPKPIVDHAEARVAALDAFSKMRE